MIFPLSNSVYTALITALISGA